MQTIRIGDREIGNGQPCFVIAEAGVNHNGDLTLARKLVDIAAESGADAVKFQTFETDELAATSAPKARYQSDHTKAQETQFEMLQRLELSETDIATLFDHARHRGLVPLSSAFSIHAADQLDRLGVEAHKVPSGELTNLPLLTSLATRGKPLIVSTGMATLEEVVAAVERIRDKGDPPLALLHCVSTYPSVPADANLRAITTLREAFEVPAGFSDHTLGYSVSLAAVALGAAIIEKHFTTDRSLTGPDHHMSLDGEDLRKMIEQIRVVEASLGDGRKIPRPSETEIAIVARRSLVASRDIAEGEILATKHVTLKRPGDGLTHSELPCLLGRRVLRPIREGDQLRQEMLE